MPSPGLPCDEHGTRRSYRQRGCRCELCIQWVRESMRAYAAQRRAAGRPLTWDKRTRPIRTATCEMCRCGFATAEASQRYCGRACFAQAKRLSNRTLVYIGPKPRADAPPVPVFVVTRKGEPWVGFVSGPCACCGENFTAMSTAFTERFCSAACARRFQKRKRGKFGISAASRLAIYARDEWACQICGDAVSKDEPPTSNWAASLDHIVPRSKGGSHDAENLRLAHRWCNAVRGDLRYYSDEDFRAGVAA